MIRTTRALRTTGLGLAAAAALGVAGCGQAGEFGKNDPRSAVSQLLNASIGQANGQRSCSLLSDAARTRLADGIAGSCRQALNASVSSMPGPYSSTSDAGRATTDLTFKVLSKSADHARVSARRGDNPALTFDLIRLSGGALQQDKEANLDTVGGDVNTDWRIDRGEQQLITVPKTPAPSTTGTTTTSAPAPPG